MRARTLFLAAVVAAVAAPSVASAKTYTIDGDHTSVTFRVRHIFTHVDGRFKEFDGTIMFDPEKLDTATVNGTIKAASIDTNVADRDEHLRSSDFFNVAEHPEIKFESTKVTDIDKSKKTAKIHGNLTMHGVTKPVVLDAAFLGEANDPWGNKKAGFTASTTVDRTQWGLAWNKVLETGSVLVGNEIEIRIDAEANVAEAK